MGTFLFIGIWDLRFPKPFYYTVGVNELATASSRALGALILKYFKIGGLDYDTFTKVFDSTVVPKMTYSSGVWGYKVYDSLERLQYRANRTFLGVGKTTPIPAICIIY